MIERLDYLIYVSFHQIKNYHMNFILYFKVRLDTVSVKIAMK